MDTQIVGTPAGKPLFAVNRGILEDNESLSIAPYGAVFAYRKNAPSVLTLSNTESQVLSIDPGVITDLSMLVGPGVLTLHASNGSTETYVFRPSAPHTFSNIQLVDVNTQYSIPVGTFAVLVEGTMQITTDGSANVYEGNTVQTLEANGSITANTSAAHFTITPSESNVTVTGEGKLITLNI